MVLLVHRVLLHGLGQVIVEDCDNTDRFDKVELEEYFARLSAYVGNSVTLLMTTSGSPCSSLGCKVHAASWCLL